MRFPIKYIGLMFLFSFFNGLEHAYAQCELIDETGGGSTTPYYIGCSQVFSLTTDTSYVITVEAPVNYGAWSMDWGDGTTDTGPSLNAGNTITHTYTSLSNTVFTDTFFFAFTSGACAIPGTVYSGTPVKSNILDPNGSITCAPGTIAFYNNSNSSTGRPATPDTEFTFDFGDGSP